MSELTYHNKLVRDLACLIDGDLFLQSSYFEHLVSEAYIQELAQEFEPILSKLVQNPELLEAHMAECPDYIIGKYAEELMTFFINEHPRLDLKMKNFQVIENGITLSEVDFVFQDLKTDETHHWELSYKFYLRYKNSWIGPNARDTLPQKLITVRTKQFPVIQHGSVKQQVSSPIKSSLYLKCYLFEAFTGVEKREAVWIKQHSLEQVQGRQDLWCILPKTYWFSSAQIISGELDIVRWPELIRACKKDIEESNKSTLIARLEKRHGVYFEKQRLFVVTDDWPELHSH